MDSLLKASNCCLRLPDHLPDEELVSIMTAAKIQSVFPQCQPSKSFKFTIGLVLLAYKGCRRVVKHGLYPPPPNEGESSEEDSEAMRVHHVVEYYTANEDKSILMDHFPVSLLYSTAVELSKKAIFVHPKTLSEYFHHELLPLDKETGSLIFHSNFLRKVAEFHEKVKRPEGTYATSEDPRIPMLVKLPREKCSRCQGSRQLYCGSCRGVRTTSANEILPPRITLPFDVLLLIHSAESLHKCTGVHVGALCQENTLDIVDWPRPHKGDDCSDIIRSLDPSRDVLLFPSPDAILASKFLWGEDDVTLAGIFTSTNGNPNTNVTRRRRLVVLEASWAHGKTMAAQIKSFREQFQLPPIPYVKLEDIVGQYWRFHCEGNAAVSTIEAIAYAAHAAGLSDDLTQDLLILFQVQKYRVLKQVEDGGKPPQALEVAGSGIGSWKQLTDQVRNFGD